MRRVRVEENACCVNKLRQNVGFETCIWRQIMTSQTAHTKYKWPLYATEWKFPNKNFLRASLLTSVKNRRQCVVHVQYFGLTFLNHFPIHLFYSFTGQDRKAVLHPSGLPMLSWRSGKCNHCQPLSVQGSTAQNKRITGNEIVLALLRQLDRVHHTSYTSGPVYVVNSNLGKF